jgi:hypothetical protein
VRRCCAAFNISNGLDAGLISNAVWKGLPLRDLLDQAGVLSGAARVRLHGVDNYTDTIPLEKAMEPTTLLAYEMNACRYRIGMVTRCTLSSRVTSARKMSNGLPGSK